MLCVYVCCVWARACVYVCVCVCCYRKLLNQVLERHEVTVEEKARIEVLRQEQATASRTQVNQNRKARISVLDVPDDMACYLRQGTNGTVRSLFQQQ